MLIHGYGQNGRSDFNKELKNALLSHDDYNVIVVDWSTAAGSSYNVANSKKDAIGQSIAKMIDWMKLDAGYLHLIGFDLGAHIAGMAGKYTTGGRVDKITGLDPIRTGIKINQSMNRLSVGDARFVEVYHSNGGKLGIMANIGDADKYISTLI
jgi:pancreatic triacylglycerol lipase